MSNLPVIEKATATSEAADLLAKAERSLGALPNMLKAMANSPALLTTYLSMSGALAGGVLKAGVRDQLALTVAQYNGCAYCLSAHTYLGARVGAEELERARYAKSDDPHTAALLALADAIVRTNYFNVLSDIEVDWPVTVTAD